MKPVVKKGTLATDKMLRHVLECQRLEELTGIPSMPTGAETIPDGYILHPAGNQWALYELHDYIDTDLAYFRKEAKDGAEFDKWASMLSSSLENNGASQEILGYLRDKSTYPIQNIVRTSNR